MKNSRVFAVQTRVEGTLQWGPLLGHGQFPAAQHSIWGDERLVLETRHAEQVRVAGGTSQQISSTYYTAYLWG